MFSLFSFSTSVGLKRTAYSLNHEVNQIDQSNPARAAELRMQAYARHQSTDIELFDRRLQIVSKPRRSVFSLNSKANRITQSKPRLAIQLRMEAVYA